MPLNFGRWGRRSYNLIKHLCAFYLQTKSNVGFIENTVKQNSILPRYLSNLWMFNEYLWISQDTSYYLRISYIYFFLRTYSTFGFSWMHSSIQDTWYDKCCSFDVQGANEWPEWQTKLLAHFNDWTDRLVQCLPSRSGSDSSAALHSGRMDGWEN